jgi:hypothetical protein
VYILTYIHIYVCTSYQNNSKNTVMIIKKTFVLICLTFLKSAPGNEFWCSGGGGAMLLPGGCAPASRGWREGGAARGWREGVF